MKIKCGYCRKEINIKNLSNGKLIIYCRKCKKSFHLNCVKKRGEKFEVEKGIFQKSPFYNNSSFSKRFIQFQSVKWYESIKWGVFTCSECKEEEEIQKNIKKMKDKIGSNQKTKIDCICSKKIIIPITGDIFNGTCPYCKRKIMVDTYSYLKREYENMIEKEKSEKVRQQKENKQKAKDDRSEIDKILFERESDEYDILQHQTNYQNIAPRQPTKRMVNCPICFGTGYKGGGPYGVRPCPHCGGSGKVWKYY